MITARGQLIVLVGLAAAVGSCQDTPSQRSVPAQDSGVVSIPRPVTPEPASEEQVALGARLFQDPRLSLDSTVSCATCHIPTRAFTEPRPVSHGVGLRARKRNTPSLINMAASRRFFDWDGRAATMEDQLRGVFSVIGDMGIDLGEAVERVKSDSSYDTEFRRAYGRPADLDAFLSALVAFEKSLVVVESRFDQFYLGGDSTALSESEIRGWGLFQLSGCAGCHDPIPDFGGSGIILFSDDLFHNLGVGYSDGRMEDVGRYAVNQRASVWGAFRTPALHNVDLTSPYMHDGSLATLEEIVQFYAQGGIKNPRIDAVMARIDFTEQDRADLVAFLRALTTDWLTDSASVSRRLLRSDVQPGASSVKGR